MTYCSKCGMKNDDDAEFCKKCGTTLSGKIKKQGSDDDCVCGSDKQNPFVPVFWGIVVILFGLWVLINFVIPRDSLPAGLHDFTFWGFLILVFALAIILTGFRILTKRK